MKFRNLISRFIRYVYNISSTSGKRALILVLKKAGIIGSQHQSQFLYRGRFPVKINKKKFFLINYGGEIETKTFWDGLFNTWESDVGWIWKELCLTSHIIFDVGANSGIYSLVAKTLNPDAEVYAFEPSNEQFEKLVRNANLNNYNIHCEKIAISNQTSELIFYDLPGSNNTTASLSPEKMKNLPGYIGGINEYKVKTITLSDYICENSIQGLELLKIDIELHEPEAIEGLGKYLKKFKPIVIIEVLRTEIAEKLNNLIPLEDYQIFHLTTDQKVQPLQQFEILKDSNLKCEWNFVLFHKSVEGRIRKETSLFERIL